MPIIRATVTVADAMPKWARPTASTAAVERGVTVSPNPSPNTASAMAMSAVGVSVVHVDIRHNAPMLRPSPISVTQRSDRTRTTKPDTSAPTAIIPASAPSAIRCWSGPP